MYKGQVNCVDIKEKLIVYRCIRDQQIVCGCVREKLNVLYIKDKLIVCRFKRDQLIVLVYKGQLIV